MLYFIVMLYVYMSYVYSVLKWRNSKVAGDKYYDAYWTDLMHNIILHVCAKFYNNW